MMIAGWLHFVGDPPTPYGGWHCESGEGHVDHGLGVDPPVRSCGAGVFGDEVHTCREICKLISSPVVAGRAPLLRPRVKIATNQNVSLGVAFARRLVDFVEKGDEVFVGVVPGVIAAVYPRASPLDPSESSARSGGLCYEVGQECLDNCAGAVSAGHQPVFLNRAPILLWD